MGHKRMEITRRRHVRIPLEASVNLYCNGEPRQQADIVDVSLSGLSLRDHDKLPQVGGRVYLEFSLPLHRDVPVMAIGEVVWRRQTESDPTAGVEVLKFFPAGRTALRSFVAGARRNQFNYNHLDS